MGMHVGGGDDGPGQNLNSEINVTPFVDVMLVLLVIFMIIAPMLNAGVEVDIPEVEAQNIEDPKGKLTLHITEHGKLFLGGGEQSKAQPVPWPQLRSVLTGNQRIAADKTLWISADKRLSYAVVVTAMAEARHAGVTKLMMLTDPTAPIPLDQLEQRAAQPPGAL